jgi:sugar transferase (PEP-CTERM/EpsH1 system associated)
MRILYFAPRNFWPLNSGACLRDHYLLRELAARASVSFFGICNPEPEERRSTNGAKCPDLGLDRCLVIHKPPSYSSWKIVRGLVGSIPLTVLNYDHVPAAEALRRLLEEQDFDAVQMEGIHLMGYLPILRSARKPPRVICDWHDIESELMYRYGLHTKNWARRAYALRTARLLENTERELLNLCDAHLMVSERDRSKLQKLAPEAQTPMHIVENGVDAGQYADHQMQQAWEKFAQGRANTRTDLVFVGSMDFHANIDAARYFALEAWPRIHAEKPGLRFVIVGSRPVPEVRELAQLPGVVVTGTVDDVRPYYCQAFAAVVPLRVGGGTRLKILEAMAAGVPVISTHIGAEGLAVHPGEDILLADSPEEMVRALTDLEHSPDRRQALAEAGRVLVRARYDWSVIGRSLYEVHSALLGRQLS